MQPTSPLPPLPRGAQMPGLSPALRKLGGSRGQPRMAVPPKRLRVGIQGPLRDQGGFGGRARRSGRIHQSHGFAGYFVSGQARVYDVAELSGAADTFSSQAKRVTAMER